MKLYKPSEMRVYYAHPMSWYGTNLEQKDLGFLQSKFRSVLNPGAPEIEAMVEQWKRQGLDVMGTFAKMIHEQADAVAFRTFKDGRLGAGVGREVFEAKIAGLHIDRIIGGYKRYSYDKDETLWLVPGDSMSIMHQLLTIEETRRRVREGEM